MSGAAQAAAAATDEVAPVTAIRFQIQDGIHRVNCAVSGEALDAVSGLGGTTPSTSALRHRSFDRFRTLIHAAALIRFRARQPGSEDPIVITSADLKRVPPQNGAPPFGTAARATASPKRPRPAVPEVEEA